MASNPIVRLGHPALTGLVLVETNADERRPPASMLKMMTELLILERIEEVLRLQFGIGQGSAVTVHSPDDTLRRILARDYL